MIIHGEVNSDRKHRFVQPLVYALLPNKTKKIYKKFLKALKRLCDGKLNPAVWVIDFEQGFIVAIYAVFGNQVVLIGCYFHFWCISFMPIRIP